MRTVRIEGLIDVGEDCSVTEEYWKQYLENEQIRDVTMRFICALLNEELTISRINDKMKPLREQNAPD